MATDAETLQQFFIRIGIDPSQVQEGSKVVATAINEMHGTVRELVDGFNTAQEGIESTVEGISESTERTSNNVNTHIGSIINVMGTLKSELLGFAGITLSIGGAFEFVDRMTDRIQSMNNASQQLGVSRQQIDGWNRAFEAAGDDPSEGSNLLTSIRSGIDGLANGQGLSSQLSAIQQITAPGTVTATSNPAEVLRSFVQALQQMGKSDNPLIRDRERALAQQAGLGVGGNVAALNGSLLQNQQYFSQHSPYGDISDQDVQNIARAKTQLDQLIDSIGVQIYKKALPPLNDFAQMISTQFADPNSPIERAIGMIGSLGGAIESFVHIGDRYARVLNDLQSGNYSAAWRDLNDAENSSGEAIDKAASQAKGVSNTADRWHNDIAGWSNRTFGTHFNDHQGQDQNALPDRNNNPGDIRSGAHGFRTFSTVREGWEALRHQLMRYYDGKTTGHSLQTVRDIISTWAPSSENNTGSYIADVARRLHVAATDHINLNNNGTMAQLMQAIASHEGFHGDLGLANQVAGYNPVGAGLSASQYITHNSGGNVSHETHIGTVNLHGNYSNMEELAQASNHEANNTNIPFSVSGGQ
ncbi:hypothetical protein LMG33818_000054 [Halomonadaceae bacterium LMG 33818]|uniref:hypothetical protein n=1 Tax=Cernens ardua TaxID=3402176 RepID=UPI003EDC5525